jgi:hypothetical protein
MTNKLSIAAKRSNRERTVAIGVYLKCNGFGRDSARIDASTDLTTSAARSLAADLIRLADESDAKADTKAAATARRKKWRDREIAAGRMVVFGSLR